MVNQILTYSLAGFAVMLLALGYVRRPHRVASWLGTLFAGSAAVAAHYDAFWPMASFTILALWCALVSAPWIDGSWRFRVGLVFSVCGLGFLSMWPTFHNMSGGKFKCPKYVQERIDFRLVAGLDLRGGLRLVYTVDVSEAIKDKRDRYYEDMQTSLTRVFGFHEGDDRPSDEAYKKLEQKVEVRASRTQANQITITLKDAADAAKLDTRWQNNFRGDLTHSESADKKVFTYRIKESVESSIRERAVSQAREIILRRVDELGLREAAVSTRDEDIIIEVPGQDEKSFTEIRDIISQTARLEFKLLDDSTDFFAPISKSAASESLPEGLTFERETVTVGMDDKDEDVITKTITYAYLEKKEGEENKDALDRFKEWTATLDLPPNRELGYQKVYDTDQVTLKQTEKGWRTFFLKSRAEVTGDQIRDAQAQPDTQGTGGWYVALNFTDQGGSIFERITGENIKKRFAIILDEKVESAPVIQSRIAGGHAQITMGARDPDIQLADSKKLELVLRSGALPAPITKSNEQRIGPSLGRQSIRLAVQGALGGAIMVVVFMIIYYRRAGIIADLAVGTNLFLQLAILASFGASMTLPGIAGLALTMGMSVDSNVLINERIREEMRDGKSARAAVEVGYGRALSAIVDGHLTTLIAGVVLAQYGTGPIKGFAVTLIVGTLTSIFCGVIVSRTMFDFWVHGRSRSAKLDMG